MHATVLDMEHVDLSPFASERIRAMRVVEYDHLFESGLLTEADKVELLAGVVVEMSPQGYEHHFLVKRLTNVLVPLLGPLGFEVAPQLPYVLSAYSKPEPDFTITPAEVWGTPLARAAWMIEVANRSLRLDRGLKAGLYAQGGIPEYWVIDAMRMTIDVMRAPVDGEYTSIQRVERTATVSPAAFPTIAICLDELVR